MSFVSEMGNRNGLFLIILVCFPSDGGNCRNGGGEGL